MKTMKTMIGMLDMWHPTWMPVLAIVASGVAIVWIIWRQAAQRRMENPIDVEQSPDVEKAFIEWVVKRETRGGVYRCVELAAVQNYDSMNRDYYLGKIFTRWAKKFSRSGGTFFTVQYKYLHVLAGKILEAVRAHFDTRPAQLDANKKKSAVVA